MKQIGFLCFLICGMSLVLAQNGPRIVVMEFTALGEATSAMGKTTASLIESHLSMKKILIAPQLSVIELLPEKPYSGETQLLELLKTQKSTLTNLNIHSILLGEISRIDDRFYGNFKLLLVDSASFQEGFAGAIHGAKDYQSFIKELLASLDQAIPQDMGLKIEATIPETTIESTEEKESPVKKKLVKVEGGGCKLESSVGLGLIWLKNHQNPAGYWAAEHFSTQCKGSTCTGAGKEWSTMGQTGLATLAFLGAGNTHRTGSFKDQVREALKYMKENQRSDGRFGEMEHGTHYMYNHAIATLAMCEAYNLSGKSPLLRESAQAGINYLVKAQNPGLAWRYEPQGGDNDSSVSAWAVMALKSAQLAELSVPPEAMEGAKNWYDSITDDYYYRAGYMQRGDPGARLAGLEGKFLPSEAMTAAAITARVFMGENPNTSPYIKGGAQLLIQNLPEWNTGNAEEESALDFYYWYYGTLAMFQVGGDSWKIWSMKLQKALVSTQIREGCAEGSWDPIDAWGSEGGRIYATAINTLSLEIYYRYSKIFK